MRNGSRNGSGSSFTISVCFILLCCTVRSCRICANANPDRALTPEERVSNERLEFLGDSVLGYVVAEYLYKVIPQLA